MTQDFPDAPRLRDAADRAVGRLRLEDFADGAESGLADVGPEWFEQPANHRAIAIDAQVGIEERSEEPRPDQSLVISGVAGALAPTVGRLIALVIGAQRAKPVRGQELGADGVEGRARLIALDQRVRQRQGHHLVWPKTRVIPTWSIHDVIAVAAVGVPEAQPRRLARLRGHPREMLAGARRPLRPVGDQLQRVVPERADLDRFAAPRAYNPVLDSCI